MTTLCSAGTHTRSPIPKEKNYPENYPENYHQMQFWFPDMCQLPVFPFSRQIFGSSESKRGSQYWKFVIFLVCFRNLVIIFVIIFVMIFVIIFVIIFFLRNRAPDIWDVNLQIWFQVRVKLHAAVSRPDLQASRPSGIDLNVCGTRLGFALWTVSVPYLFISLSNDFS